MIKKGFDKRAAITGIIIPVAWSRTGRVTALAIATAGESEYWIEKNEQARQLMGLVNETVNVTGRVRLGRDGKKRVNVERYEIVSRLRSISDDD